MKTKGDWFEYEGNDSVYRVEWLLSDDGMEVQVYPLGSEFEITDYLYEAVLGDIMDVAYDEARG